MFPNKNQAIVLENEIFKGLSNTILGNYNLKNFVDIKEGNVIYKQGDLSDFVYLVIHGEVKLKFPGLTGTPQFQKKSAYQYFGEKELLEGIPRKSSSVADTDCVLYILPKVDVAALIQSSPEFKSRITGGTKDGKEDPSIRREIIFSDSNEKITDIPFFKSDKIDLNRNEYSDDSYEDNTGYNPEPLDSNEMVINPIPESMDLSNESDPYDYSQKFEELNPESFPDESSDTVETSDPLLKDPTPEAFQEPEPFKETEESNEPLQSNDITFLNVESEKEDIQSWDFGEINQKEEKEVIVPAINEDIYVDILVCIEKIGSILTLSNLFKNIPSAAGQLISASSGTLFIHDQEKSEFYTIEDSQTESRTKNTEGLPGLCYINQDIINFDDDSIDLERNIILFPVQNAQREMVAVLQLNDSGKGYFDEKDKKIINAIIPFIADSIENAVRSNKELSKERLNALGVMSKFLVNDIKRPLLMIKQYSEFLKQKSLDEDTLKILSLIANQSEQIIDLVETSREFSDNNLILKREETEITLIMDEYLTLLAEFTDSKKVKVFRKYEGQGSVNVDKRKLFQAIYQIVKNACDSMIQGGNIFFLIKRNDTSIEIEIKDEGIGIPMELQSSIFDPFISYSKRNSAGLGLSLAQLIITKQDGMLTFISEEGKGSTFIISLPAADVI